MKKISTPQLELVTRHILTSAKEMRPKRSTREFVRQFARCYSFSPTSDATIGGLVLN